jgi:hypothetical protein
MAIEELQKARRLFSEIAEDNPRAARAQVRHHSHYIQVS